MDPQMITDSLILLAHAPILMLAAIAVPPALMLLWIVLRGGE